MKKLLTFSMFTLSAICSYSHAASIVNPFEQLRPKIEEMADAWIEKHVQPFSYDRNQKLINLLSSTNITPEDINNAIEADPSLSDTFDAIGNAINFFLQTYIETVQKKWSAKERSADEQQEFFNQLQQKVMDLINYISSVYYEKLNVHVNKSQK